MPSMPSRSFASGATIVECTAPLAATFSKLVLVWPGRLSTSWATSESVKPGRTSTG